MARLEMTSNPDFSKHVGKSYRLNADGNHLHTPDFETTPVRHVEIRSIGIPTRPTKSSLALLDDAIRLMDQAPFSGKSRPRSEVESFKTGKGSQYAFLPDGRSQRNKLAIDPMSRKIGGLKPPQDLLVFIRSTPAQSANLAFFNHDGS
jgi:hypothetical protein